MTQDIKNRLQNGGLTDFWSSKYELTLFPRIKHETCFVMYDFDTWKEKEPDELAHNFELPDKVTVFRILATGSEPDLDELFDAHITPSLLICDSQISCSSIDRSDHIEESWAFWVSLENQSR